MLGSLESLESGSGVKLARSTLVFTVLCVGAACAREPSAVCERTPQGVYLYIDERAERYGDIFAALADGRYRDPEKPAYGGSARSSEIDIQPRVCPSDGTIKRNLSVGFPPRSSQDAFAALHLYMDSEDRIKVVEFLVAANAP